MPNVSSLIYWPSTVLHSSPYNCPYCIYSINICKLSLIVPNETNYNFTYKVISGAVQPGTLVDLVVLYCYVQVKKSPTETFVGLSNIERGFYFAGNSVL